MHSHDKIAAVFDDWASTDRAQKMADGHQFSARYGFERLNVQAGHRCLDIGCGLGYAMHWAAAIHPSVSALGVDVSGTMVQEAERLALNCPNLVFRHGEFPDVVRGETFDRIFSVEALYYLPDLDQALNSVFQCLKPEGRFVTVIDHYWENEASHTWSQRVNVPLQLWSISQWRQGLEAAGFLDVVCEQKRHPAVDSTPMWAQVHGSLIVSGRRGP